MIYEQVLVSVQDLRGRKSPLWGQNLHGRKMAVGVGHWTECFLGVFSAWPHPQGDTAFALLSVGFLTKNYQVVKKPTNKRTTCSKSKGANSLLRLSRFKWKP